MRTSTNLTVERAESAPKCPGTIWNNHGRWWWSVRLPGEKRRTKRPLKMPGATLAMSTSRPFGDAEAAAWRLWEEATHAQKRGQTARTVNEICDAWTAHALEYYRDADGKPTSQARNSAMDVRMLRDLYGPQQVTDLTHAHMLAVRDALVRSGICRSTVNGRLGTIKRMWKWALDEALIPATVKAELSQVEPLKAHRSAARETAPVRPVDDATVEATLAVLAPNTADMVRVHRLTGMRPEEVCALAWSCIDTTATPWIYRPTQHKNAWRMQPRAICLGPKARAILERIGRADDHPFSPIRAMREHLDAMRAARKTPVQPSQVDRSRPDAERVPGPVWTTDAYSRTIARACERAGVPHWSANQLRHSLATQVRRTFGLDATRAVLGHSTGARITDRYSYDAIEDEMIHRAAPAIEALG